MKEQEEREEREERALMIAADDRSSERQWTLVDASGRRDREGNMMSSLTHRRARSWELTRCPLRHGRSDTP